MQMNHVIVLLYLFLFLSKKTKTRLRCFNFLLHVFYSMFRVNLELHGTQSTAGLARKGMCGEGTKCSVVEDNGLSSAFVMAHETGHV